MADEKTDRDLIIGTSEDRILIRIGPDGTLTYGPDYTPDEAAKVFWEAMARHRKDYEERLVFFTHVEGLLARVGAQDLRVEAARAKAENTKTIHDQAQAERSMNQLQVLWHELIEFARGIALRDKDNRESLN